VLAPSAAGAGSGDAELVEPAAAAAAVAASVTRNLAVGNEEPVANAVAPGSAAVDERDVLWQLLESSDSDEPETADLAVADDAAALRTELAAAAEEAAEISSNSMHRLSTERMTSETLPPNELSGEQLLQKLEYMLLSPKLMSAAAAGGNIDMKPRVS
jgi:hypothetical protein